MDISEDKHLIEHPINWPQKGVLCMKKRSTVPGEWPSKFGVIFDFAPTTVVCKSIDELLRMTAEQIAETENEEFESVDAMLAAGWAVD